MISTSAFDAAIMGLLAPVADYLRDATVSEILVNGPARVFIEQRGKLVRTDARFVDGEDLLAALRAIAQYVKRPLDEAHPILEARLPDGSRVEAVLPPIASEGPTVAIRRFSRERLTLERLLELGALTEAAAELLKAFVLCKRNIVVSGGTGSGKTTFLNALAALVPESERIVVLEDAKELQIHHDHVVSFETRAADSRGKHAVSMRDLFKASLRLRPDRIVLGEIRGGEALELIQAMTSGHGGSLSTVHATYPNDALHRLETLALMSGLELPLIALRAQLASAVDVIVQTERLRDGRRVVTHVTEVLGVDPTRGYLTRDLFSFVRTRTNGSAGSSAELVPTGALPACLPLLSAHEVSLPPAMVVAARAAGHAL